MSGVFSSAVLDWLPSNREIYVQFMLPEVMARNIIMSYNTRSFRCQRHPCSIWGRWPLLWDNGLWYYHIDFILVTKNFSCHLEKKQVLTFILSGWGWKELWRGCFLNSEWRRSGKSSSLNGKRWKLALNCMKRFKDNYYSWGRKEIYHWIW